MGKNYKIIIALIIGLALVGAASYWVNTKATEKQKATEADKQLQELKDFSKDMYNSAPVPDTQEAGKDKG